LIINTCVRLNIGSAFNVQPIYRHSFTLWTSHITMQCSALKMTLKPHISTIVINRGRMHSLEYSLSCSIKPNVTNSIFWFRFLNIIYLWLLLQTIIISVAENEGLWGYLASDSQISRLIYNIRTIYASSILVAICMSMTQMGAIKLILSKPTDTRIDLWSTLFQLFRICSLGSSQISLDKVEVCQNLLETLKQFTQLNIVECLK